MTRWMYVCVCAVLLTATLAGAQPPAAQPSPNAVVTGELVIEPPTLINLGFEWFIQGDANRNAAVEVAFRKRGASTWSPALPLLRLQGERIYAESRIRSDRTQHVRREHSRSRARHRIRGPADAGGPGWRAGRTHSHGDGEHARRATAICRRPGLSCLPAWAHRSEDRAGIRRSHVRVQLLVRGH
jgi:hypothetical protein